MIQIRNLQKSYGTVQAIKDISIDIPKGQVLGLLGPNGAGKSSTLRIITGFLRPSSGSVTVANFDVLEEPLEVKKLIGYLPESAPLYTNMLVYDYLIFMARSRSIPAHEQHQRVLESAARCALTERMSQPIHQLSKGYRQRVGLAMAMLNEPEVLILDEPTSGLDPNQILEIRSIIREIGREKTVIFSTHILSEAESTCDRIVIINQGRIIADDEASRLSSGVFENTEIELLLADSQEATMVEEKLRRLDGVLQIKSQEEENFLRVHLGCQRDIRLDLARFLKEQSWLVIEFYEKKRSLENVFHRLTEEGGVAEEQTSHTSQKGAKR